MSTTPRAARRGVAQPRAARPQASAPARRNPWLRTFLTPVPLAFVAGTVGTAVLGGFGVPGLSTWQSWLTGGLVLLFFMGAIGRLSPRMRTGLIAMVPPRLPAPALIVAATGILEAAGAIGLLIPATHRAAAICLALLLVAVFPANVHAARTHATASPLLPRTVEQLVFLTACLAVAFA